MNYLERYLNGEHERVWAELQGLGPAALEGPRATNAMEVALETMRRVRRNCERLVSRLRGFGYEFDRYPDGTGRSHASSPLVDPSPASRASREELIDEAGPLPLSLHAFWEVVGSVDLIGRNRSWPDGLDPLAVDPPEGALAFLFEEEDEESGSPVFFAGLAPDDLHKDNLSGGDPYGVRLPHAEVDFRFLNERHDLLFVPYLRLAVLRYGGFPGLEGRESDFPPLRDLIDGLEPF